MPSRKTKNTSREKPRVPNKSFEKRYSKYKRTPTERTKLLCRHCHAVYENKGWQPFNQLNPQHVDELKMSICQACHEEKNHVSDGILHLSGSGIEPHKEEIKHIVINAGKSAEEDDILDRVERVDDGVKNQITVYTTKNQLAVKIGKKVASAYKGGELNIKWSKNDKPVEVYWSYNKEPK